MIRVSLLLVLVVVGRAQAQASGFDQARLAAVYTEALTFVAPRILQPVPVSRLTLWGLQGLSALDPEVRTVATVNALQLFIQSRLVLQTAVPAGEDPATWANAATAVTAASLPVSLLIRNVSIQAVIQGFFDQMFNRIDPYSRYVPPGQAAGDQMQRGARAGVGLTVEQHGSLHEVQSVAPDGPAFLAGIRTGDIITTINGQAIQDQNSPGIAGLLSGTEGSVVTLSWRGHDGRPRQATLLRAALPPETVFPDRSTDLLVLRISSFSRTTASHVALAVQDALSTPHPVEGIVLDLRDNRGGLLRQAVATADTFLPAGVVATTVGRDPDSLHVWYSTAGELAENVPLVVLVDGHTASAAEILAAALADRGRAVVVGSATVGKGTVQSIDPLPDGGELLVTWSQLLAPLGWPIQGLGVLPQVCTSGSAETLGRQMDSLAKGLQPMAEAVARVRAARVPLAPSHVLELRAPCPASVGHGADMDAARQLVANPAAYAAALLPPIAER